MTKIATKLIGLAMLALCGLLYANPYWVSPTGAATWNNAQSATPLTGEDCCSLTTAKANVAAGNTVYLRDGIYTVPLDIQNKTGTLENRITFAAWTGEVPIIQNATNEISTYVNSLLIKNSDYIVVRGITFVAQDNSSSPSGKAVRLMIVSNDSDYCEIDSCVFDGAEIGQTRAMTTCAVWSNSDYGWIHGCTFKKVGMIDNTGNDAGGCLHIGSPSASEIANNWTVENNVIFHGAHHTLETFSQYTVVRNNRTWNDSYLNDSFGNASKPPDENGLYGNRCFQIDSHSGSPTVPRYGLIEGNRLSASGSPPDDNGEGLLTIASCNNIVRFNSVYNSQQAGINLKDGPNSSYNRVYNNTVYDSGNQPSTRTGFNRSAIMLSNYPTFAATNVIANNLIYLSDDKAIAMIGVSNSVLDGGNTYAANYVGVLDANGDYVLNDADPLFANPIIGDPSSSTAPNLALSGASPAIDAGSHLTTANGSGNASVDFVVVDASFFQDGTWGSPLSNIQADWIAVGSVGNIAQISAIDYGTQSITLTSPLTWSNGDKVWLYAKSDGQIVLRGAAPDIGAFEYFPLTRIHSHGQVTLQGGAVLQP